MATHAQQPAEVKMARKSEWESELDDSSESDDDLEGLLLLYLRKRKLRRRRSVWVRPIFSKRRQQGEYHNLLQEMRFSDPQSHFCYLRMSKERFDCLLSLVCPLIHIYYCIAIIPQKLLNKINHRLLLYFFVEDFGASLEYPFFLQKDWP